MYQELEPASKATAQMRKAPVDCLPPEKRTCYAPLPMTRRAPALLALLVTLGVVALALQEGKNKQKQRAAAALEQQKAFSAAAQSAPVPADTSPDAEEASLAAPVLAAPSAAPGMGATSFHLLPDGSPVPPLATDAPKRVKLGVALFRYKGVQDSAASGRSREQALTLAKKASALGKDDFAAAVKEGDRGSNANIGWVRRRILERSVEYAVFSLKKGEVSEQPVDTPRGFWVVKRLR